MLKKVAVSLTSLMLLAPSSLPLMAEEVASSTTSSAVACTMEYAPVCGVNGKTYANLCLATAAGTQVANNGTCQLARKEVRQSNVVINGKLEAMEAMTAPTLVKVKIERLNIATSSDSVKVGQVVAIKVTDKTEIVRRYKGKATLAELALGDSVHINAQLNSDGILEAKLLKDDSILKTEISAQAGVVKEVNASGKYFVIGKMSVEQFDSEHFQGNFFGDYKGKAKELKQQVDKMRQENKKKMEALKDEQKKKLEEAKNKVKDLRDEQKKKMEEMKKIMKIKADKNKSFEMKKWQVAKAVSATTAKNKKAVDTRVEKNIENYKILVNDKTKITLGTTTISLADIKVGDKVRVRGVVNTKNKTLTAELVMVLRLVSKPTNSQMANPDITRNWNQPPAFRGMIASGTPDFGRFMPMGPMGTSSSSTPFFRPLPVFPHMASSTWTASRSPWAFFPGFASTTIASGTN